MRRGPSGRHLKTVALGGEAVNAFLPNPLPPKPGLTIDPKLRDKLDEALLALGRLDSVTTILPETHLFLYTYVRKEAVLSSQIEGTQSSLKDLLLYEALDAPGLLVADVADVSNYVAAMEHGLRRIREGAPLSNRLIREIHKILLRRGRGAGHEAGEYRRSQNWIGGSRPGTAVFVPPPADHVLECMGLLEKWLHDSPQRTPPLLKAALAHVQFETIHPFLDGNGRVGRLLVTLILCVEKSLRDPLLYLSLYLKQHREEYYELLTRVRREGDWEAWTSFFADGVRESATVAVVTAQRLVQRAREDRQRISDEVGRGAGTALRIHQVLQERPVSTALDLAKRVRLSNPTVFKGLNVLQSLGLVNEITGQKRNRVFSYEPYLRILSEGTEPIPERA